MAYGFSLLTAGVLLVYSGWTNSTIAEVMRGLAVRKGGAGDTGFVSLLSAPTTGMGEAMSPKSGGTGPPLGRARKNPAKEKELQRAHPELKPGIRTVAAMVLARFPGLTITSTNTGDHAENSLHYQNRAVDIGGSTQEMNKAAKWIAKYLTPALAEGIHNPGLSVDEHKHVPSSFWGSTTWSAHGNHIHLGV